MKAIKLIIIFVLLVGTLLLIIYVPNIWKPTHNGDDKWGEEDLINIKEKCEEIRNVWNKSAGWDQSLYQALRGDIDQSKNMGMFSREGYNTVNNTLRETAVNKACAGYMDALHNKNFNSTDLSAQYDGVQYLKKNEKLADDKRVKDVEIRQTLYVKIKKFIGSSHKISPHFNTSTADWESFSMLQNKILNTAQSYRQNSLYVNEMSHIPSFKSGLSDSALKEKTNKQSPAFYRGLCNQIIEYFKNEEATPDKVNLLNQIYKNFSDQETNYGLEELANFKVNYGE